MKNTNDGKTKLGQLFLVDLAGSEKIGKTGATGQTLEEAKKINKSLSALGNVINSLTDGKSTHIPYRDSKLTRILQESLGGNSRTTLIINCSPSSYNVPETISTLRFGTRAKSIKNKATINQALSPEELKAMVKKLNTKLISFNCYIKSLEVELEVWRSGGSVSIENRVKFIKIKVDEDQKPNSGVISAQSEPNSKTQDSITQKTSNQNKITTLNVDNPSPATAALSYSRSASPSSTARLSTNSPNFLSSEMPLPELLMRPMTPYTMAEDEKEEFLKRENELVDQLGEKERALLSKIEEYSQLFKEHEFITKELETLRLKSDSLASDLSHSLLDKEKLEYNLREIQISIEALTEDKNEIETLNQNLYSQIESLKLELKESNSNNLEKTSEVSELKEKLINSQTKNDKVSGILRSSNVKRESLKDDISESDASTSIDIKSLQNQIMQLHVAEQNKEDIVNQLKTENGELLRKYTEAESQYNKLMAEYEEFLEGSIAADEAQSTNENNNLTEVKNKLESQFLTRIDQQSKDISELQEEKQRRINEINSLNELLTSEKNSKSDLEMDLLALKNDLEKAKVAAQMAQSNAYASLQASAASPSRPSFELRSGSFGINDLPKNENLAVSELQSINQKLLEKLNQAERVRYSLMRDVQNRCEKIIELELSVDELAEKNNLLDLKLEKQSQKQKTALLEQNILQLNLFQKELMTNNTEMKKSLTIMSRQLQARTERIQHLEDRLTQYSSENEAQKALIEQMNTQRVLDISRARTGQASNFNFSKLPFGRVAKPIRGGGKGGIPTEGITVIRRSGTIREMRNSVDPEVDENASKISMESKIVRQPQAPTKNRSSWLQWPK
ncbi:hypothetical protein BB561_001292 [Smittium simulii]|uniref:Kinesin-like protein n=1 Tax=Smittium simulii TaxID=133385 RepID=A0A2T9YV80_9FUNG|nr:hypothetical protein BB561_001292 [Smittium simulii]